MSVFDSPTACSWKRSPVFLKSLAANDRRWDQTAEPGVQLVGARFGDDVHHAAGRAPELRVGAAGHHLELLHRLQRDVDGRALAAHLLNGAHQSGDRIEPDAKQEARMLQLRIDADASTLRDDARAIWLAPVASGRRYTADPPIRVNWRA